MTLPFGITVPGDAFQRKLDAMYSCLSNTIFIVDDMVIWGENPDFHKHDEALDRYMQVTSENNLYIDIHKIQYHKDQV